MNYNSTNTGLLFGSFNPIHIGHLVLANYILEYSHLDEIWFVISPQNPFKNSDELITENHRLQMVEIAIQKEPRFKACDVEFDLPRPSYTIHTLEKLQKNNPLNRFTIIMGGDNLLSIDRWKNASEILSKFPVIVYPRPGFNNDKLPEGAKIQIVEAPLLDISSTLIRDGVAAGKNLHFLMPEGVFQYIEKHGLYGVHTTL